jgi:hypothetical protein
MRYSAVDEVVSACLLVDPLWHFVDELGVGLIGSERANSAVTLVVAMLAADRGKIQLAAFFSSMSFARRHSQLFPRPALAIPPPAKNS